MGQPIEQRGDHLRFPEHAAPLVDLEIGRYDERDALVEFADEVKEQRSSVGGERQIYELIKHDGVLNVGRR